MDTISQPELNNDNKLENIEKEQNEKEEVIESKNILKEEKTDPEIKIIEEKDSKKVLSLPLQINNRRISMAQIESQPIQSEISIQTAIDKSTVNDNNSNLKLSENFIEGDLVFNDLLGVETNYDNKQEPYEKEENIFSKIIINSKKSPNKNSIKNSLQKSTPNKKGINHIRGTFAINTDQFEKNKGKYLYETVKERKAYENKIETLNNRIKKLKDHEDEINKKVILMKTLHTRDEKIKQDKFEVKKIVVTAKIVGKEKLSENKIKILNEKVKREETLAKIKKEVVNKNKRNFDMARNDKLLIESMVNQFNSHNSNINNYKYVKAKQEELESKTHRFTKQSEKEEKVKMKFENKILKENLNKEILIRKLKNLEEVESQCMENLKITIKNKELEFGKINKKLSLGLNSSMIELGSKKMKLNENENENTPEKKNVNSSKKEVTSMYSYNRWM